MSLAMNKEERESFLADLHVGVICIEQAGRAPVAVPVWYEYSPEVGISLVTDHQSIKGKCLEAAGRFTLVAQEEALPYRYVSVEGPITETRDCNPDEDIQPLALRYLQDAKRAEEYTEGCRNPAAIAASRVYIMRPEIWKTVDYGKGEEF
jgi:nitroimidazol reductase NimA-like FMN-containing flavoprotein (pyridoxamine 5'-phosphate oxidase superfamily)